VVQPLAAQRYRVQFTASAEFVDKLKQAKALLGHQGNPDVADVLELALDQLIAQRMKKKFALTNQARRRGENSVQDLTLRCRAHNQHQARRDFGPNHIERAVARRRASNGPAQRFTFPGDNRAPSSSPEQRDTVPSGHVASP